MDPDDLTPVAQDYLKVIWSRTEWGDPPMTTGDLAARFGTSPATVTETVRRLAGQGLVEYVPYRPVRLTEVGAAGAVAMVRRHRLLETYLVRELGYGWDEVHDEAERLEHAASPELIDRIDARLGHPVADPHGDPIPAADGTTSLPAGAELLVDVTEPGAYRVLRISDADPTLLAAATSLDLEPGQLVRVVSAGPVTLLPDGATAPVPVDDALAAAVRVGPVDAGSPRTDALSTPPGGDLS